MKNKNLNHRIEKFQGKKILVVGDLMVDQFIRGKVARISPEAPVPVVEVASETYAPGGAGNVAVNLQALGAEVWVAGMIGRDSTGQKLIENFNQLRVDTQGIAMDGNRPTILKTRVIAEHQQIVRFDREIKVVLSQKAEAQIFDYLSESIPRCHGVILSDYGKGTLTPTIIDKTVQWAKKAGVVITVDPKPEHFAHYKQVDAITPNWSEAWALMRQIPQTDEKSLRQLGQKMLKQLRCRAVLITRGERGMTLFENPGHRIRITHIPTVAKEVFDVTGAGDTVIAAFSLALAGGANMVCAAQLANAAAGVVVGKLGTATCSLRELKKTLTKMSG